MMFPASAAIAVCGMIFVTPGMGQNRFEKSVSFPGYGAVDKTCVRWNDGCSACTVQVVKGSLRCSNIGVACQPKEIQCGARMLVDRDYVTSAHLVLNAVSVATGWGGALLAGFSFTLPSVITSSRNGR